MSTALNYKNNKKSKPFYQIPYIGTANQYYLPDFKSAEVFLNIFPDKDFYFFIKKGNNVADMRAKRAVKQCIKNGHKDAEVWAYVNPFEKGVELNIYNQYRSVYHPKKPKNYYAVLDIDRALDFAKYATNIDHLQSQMTSLGYPKFLVIKTAPFRWHLLIDFQKQEPTKEVLIKLASTLGGLNYEIAISLFNKNSEEFDKYFKTVGIDGAYLRQHYSRHKIRVPGFINSNRIVNEQLPTEKYPTSYYTVKSNYKLDNSKFHDIDAWLNSELMEDLWNKLHLNAMSKKEQEARQRKIDKEFAKKVIGKNSHLNKLNNKHIRTLSKLLKPYIKERSFAFACHLTDNISRLKKGNLNICQVSMSKKLEISQPQVSKILKKLCEKGFLEVKKNGYYNYDDSKGPRETKVYGWGPVTRDVLQNANEQEKIAKTKKDELVEPYEPGQSNNQFLKDIRNLYYLGIDEVNAVKIIKRKCLSYPKVLGKFNSRAIRNAYKLWDQKAHEIKKIKPSFQIKTKLIINPKELILGSQ